MTSPERRPGERRLDPDQPNAARMYDYFLGGAHNFAADRAAADAAAAAFPGLPATMRAGRAFLRRVVRHLVGAGITQFLDLGSGIPTLGNVHEVAQEIDPSCRVVYVDIDPVAVAASRSILGDAKGVAVVRGDLREPGPILADPAVTGLLDFGRPLGVLMIAVLHFVPDADDPADVVAAYRDALAPGSYLAIGHAAPAGRRTGGPDGDSPDRAGTGSVDAARRVYDRTPDPVTPRDQAQVTALFAGFDLLEPGVVEVTRWHPDPARPDPGGVTAGYAGLGILR